MDYQTQKRWLIYDDSDIKPAKSINDTLKFLYIYTNRHRLDTFFIYFQNSWHAQDSSELDRCRNLLIRLFVAIFEYLTTYQDCTNKPFSEMYKNHITHATNTTSSNSTNNNNTNNNNGNTTNRNNNNNNNDGVIEIKDLLFYVMKTLKSFFGGHCWRDKLCLNKILTRLLAKNLYKIRYGIDANGYITSKKKHKSRIKSIENVCKNDDSINFLIINECVKKYRFHIEYETFVNCLLFDNKLMATYLWGLFTIDSKKSFIIPNLYQWLISMFQQNINILPSISCLALFCFYYSFFVNIVIEHFVLLIVGALVFILAQKDLLCFLFVLIFIFGGFLLFWCLV